MKSTRVGEDQLNKTYVRLGKRTAGLLYEPIEKTEKTQIAVLVMHSDEDYCTFPTGVN